MMISLFDFMIYIKYVNPWQHSNVESQSHKYVAKCLIAESQSCRYGCSIPQLKDIRKQGLEVGVIVTESLFPVILTQFVQLAGTTIARPEEHRQINLVSM